jgi:hypothetical protein
MKGGRDKGVEYRVTTLLTDEQMGMLRDLSVGQKYGQTLKDCLERCWHEKFDGRSKPLKM